MNHIVLPYITNMQPWMLIFEKDLGAADPVSQQSALHVAHRCCGSGGAQWAVNVI